MEGKLVSTITIRKVVYFVNVVKYKINGTKNGKTNDAFLENKRSVHKIGYIKIFYILKYPKLKLSNIFWKTVMFSNHGIKYKKKGFLICISNFTPTWWI